jgi:hypothetical protein
LPRNAHGLSGKRALARHTHHLAARCASDRGQPAPASGEKMTVSRLVAVVALALCFVAGYFLAGLWSSARDTSPLAQICARVDYVNGLQENLKGQEAASEEVRAEFNALVEQCRTALRNRADEND